MTRRKASIPFFIGLAIAIGILIGSTFNYKINQFYLALIQMKLRLKNSLTTYNTIM